MSTLRSRLVTASLATAGIMLMLHCTTSVALVAPIITTTTYEYSPSPAAQPHTSATRNDILTNGNGKLNDGVLPVGTLANYDTGANVMYLGVANSSANPHPEVTFDLGGDFYLDQLLISYMGESTGVGVTAPTVLTSASVPMA